jgi:poly-gamma-glutamate synthase PgsB/CapB
MLIINIILGILIFLLVIEKLLTMRNVNRIQLRVHVNGTRGKSSVTEYVAAGILNAQPEVMAKITGTVPTIIHNGNRKIIYRYGAARIQEQINIIRYAASRKVRTMILECMSLAPELQLLESTLFKPHIYVITNIRDDHREEMGRTTEEQAESISNAIPYKCTVITNETCYLDKIKEKAASRNSSVLHVNDFDLKPLNDLPNSVFPENVLLAIAVCESAGIDNKLAEDGIRKFLSEIKSPLITVNYGGNEIKFLNAFEVNDVESTINYINVWQKNIGYRGKFSMILNTRVDRPIRTDLFTGLIADMFSSVEHIIITGDHASRAEYSLLKSGIKKESIHIWKEKHLKNVKQNLCKTVGDKSLVIGIGNIGGNGLKILNELK